MSFFNKLFSTKKKISDKATADKKSVVDEQIEKSISKEVISQKINVSVQKKKDSLNKGLKLSSESFFSKISKLVQIRFP